MKYGHLERSDIAVRIMPIAAHLQHCQVSHKISHKSLTALLYGVWPPEEIRCCNSLLLEDALQGVDADWQTLLERRCKTLKQMSMEGCGIGPEGARALSSALIPNEDPALVSLQPK
jgi:hypothetical protein